MSSDRRCGPRSGPRTLRAQTSGPARTSVRPSRPRRAKGQEMAKVAAAAVDLGSSSGRVVVGTLDDESLSLDEVHRFPHAAHSVNGDLVWDLFHLEEQIGVGITRALDDRVVAVSSVAVVTRGADSVLPVSYTHLTLPTNSE